MEHQLFLAAERGRTAVKARLYAEEWPQVTISLRRPEPYRRAGLPLHWRFWSGLNDTSHVDLRINMDEGDLDLIELIGRFQTREVTVSRQPQAQQFTTDVVFDLERSGLALPERNERIVDTTGNVELLMSESSVLVPLLTDPVAEWRYPCSNVAVGSSRDGVLVALLFDKLNADQHSAFNAIWKVGIIRRRPAKRGSDGKP